MNTMSLMVGLAGSALVGTLATAVAQEQPAGSVPAPTAPAAAPSCSGLGCLFSSGPAAAPQQAVAPPAPVAAASGQPESTTAPGPAESTTVADDAPAKPKLKPLHPVTIAVDPDEVGRLKSLAASMPRGKVKIVTNAARAADADFSVDRSLEPHETGEKTKLFTEQMHIVAGDAILSVADLKGKVVSFGPDKSAGAEAGRKAFEALNIPVKETPLDLDNALDGLATGDVAAVVVLAPQPVERLAKLAGSGLHLVAWPQDGALPAGAVASSIEAASYPGLAKSDAAIRAVGVDAVLRISAKGARRPESRSFLTALGQRSATLSKRGFDLIKADLETHTGRRFASDETR